MKKDAAYRDIRRMFDVSKFSKKQLEQVKQAYMRARLCTALTRGKNKEEQIQKWNSRIMKENF